MEEWEGQKRVTIENVKPKVNCGQYPVKRIIGEQVTVEADIFVDGHDKVGASLLYRRIPSKKKKEPKAKWLEVPMTFKENDHWQATFTPDKEGEYEYTLKGWIDYYATWAAGLEKKFDAGQDVTVELQIGAEIMERSETHVKAATRKKLQKWGKLFSDSKDHKQVVELALSEEVLSTMRLALNDRFTSIYRNIYRVQVDRNKALFSAWYEIFPRSTAAEPGRHGTFSDCVKLLPRIAEMGFDTIYLPPIHPIGKSHRKGLNNATTAQAGDPGSPWAIGGEEGGHKAIHPELGSMEEFERFVQKANSYEIDIALDFAIQCSPDHPYVKEHPDWFVWRPDGTIQYAENPPKKYQDVLPLNFETDDWKNLWKELKSIVEFWIDKGVRIFRVDNPHTKPFTFWEWMISEVRRDNPDIIFLAEAFTPPRIMERLGKIGFTQSYTYFTWRDTAEEMQEYLEELTQTNRREYFRPNFWPNTPDILPISLEHKPEPAFIARVIMAATLSSNYGIYGPIFELGLNEPFPGKEEYIDSEKYEIKHWDWDKQTKTRQVITDINRIRTENPALQTTWHIEFCECDNAQLLCFAKTDQEKQNRMIIVVNMDPYHVQSGWMQIPQKFLNLSEGEGFIVNDLLTGNKYNWSTGLNYVELHPQAMPAHVFRVENSEKQ